MWQAIIIGATLIGGTLLLHYLYKNAISEIKKWIKNNSSFFSKAVVERGFVVFSYLMTGVIRYYVVAKRHNDFVLIDEKTVTESEMPADARSKLLNARKQKMKSKGLFGPSVQTENVHVAQELQATW